MNAPNAVTISAPPPETPSEQHRAPTLKAVEAKHISGLLEQYNGNRQKVAEALGVSLRTLYRKLKKYNLRRT